MIFLQNEINCPEWERRSCTSPVDPPECPGLRVPHAKRHFRVAGSHASKSDFLSTCPTPTRNQQLIHASEMHGSIVYMVFQSNKFANIGEQGNGHWCLSVFELIRQIITHKAQPWQIIGARFRFGRHRKRWQNMSAYLTNEISYRRKKLVTHLNW